MVVLTEQFETQVDALEWLHDKGKYMQHDTQYFLSPTQRTVLYVLSPLNTKMTCLFIGVRVDTGKGGVHMCV